METGEGGQTEREEKILFHGLDFLVRKEGKIKSLTFYNKNILEDEEETCFFHFWTSRWPITQKAERARVFFPFCLLTLQKLKRGEFKNGVGTLFKKGEREWYCTRFFLPLLLLSSPTTTLNVNCPRVPLTFFHHFVINNATRRKKKLRKKRSEVVVMSCRLGKRDKF